MKLVVPLLVLAGIWWAVWRALRAMRREHEAYGRCWCSEVHALPPFPTRVPMMPPPPPKKAEPTIVHIRLL